VVYAKDIKRESTRTIQTLDITVNNKKQLAIYYKHMSQLLADILILIITIIVVILILASIEIVGIYTQKQKRKHNQEPIDYTADT
ncbi:13926_t:CDS:1, partial [Racocetra persica]